MRQLHSVRESLGFRPLEVVYLDNPRQMECMWQVAFPDLAKQLPTVGDTARPVSLVRDLSLPLSVKNCTVQFHKRPDLINNWCLALLNSQVHRCSIDGEWTTERRMNGGPGRKQGKLAVLSVSYFAPDTPRGLTHLPCYNSSSYRISFVLLYDTLL